MYNENFIEVESTYKFTNFTKKSLGFSDKKISYLITKLSPTCAARWSGVVP